MSPGTRRTASAALLVIGALCLLLGVFSLYARQQIFDADRFADKAVQTLDDSDVRGEAANRITDELIKANPDLITAKPLLQSASAAVINTGAFHSLLRQAAASAYRTVIDGHDDAVVTVASVGVLVSQALQQFAPEKAPKVPDVSAALLDFSEGGVATDAAQIAEKLRIAGLILPPLALLLLVSSVLLAEDRRGGVIRAGAASAGACLLGLVVLVVVRGVVLAGIDGGTDHDAASAIWDVFLGPLEAWYLLTAGLGIVVASAAASALKPVDLGAPLAALWARVSREPESVRGRIVWALGVAAAGLLMVLEPDLVLRALIIVAGAYLISRAVSTLISLAAPPGTRKAADRTGRQFWARVAIGLAVAAAVGAFGVAVFAQQEAKHVPAPSPGCNGSEDLCGKRLNDVVFPSTHNSYAGAGYPGFLFPEQEGTISTQLEGGVRGLWVDTYYGIPGSHVYTDTSKIDPALNAQLEQTLGPKFTAAGADLRSQIAKPSGQPKLYFCHGFCELGAVDATDSFGKIADFLRQNQNEVLLIDLEDYTTPEDTVNAIEEAGLDKYVYKGPAGPPWPTLQEMIDSGGRVLVFAEHMTEDAPSWYFSFEDLWQETPFQFKKPSQMNCKQGRGSPSNSLFLINNWIDTDPTPKPSNAAKVNAYKFLLDRAQRCQRKRGLLPNALNVDFWGTGDLFKVARTMNSGG